jgi:hypothetical protein
MRMNQSDDSKGKNPPQVGEGMGEGGQIHSNQMATVLFKILWSGGTSQGNPPRAPTIQLLARKQHLSEFPDGRLDSQAAN